jgi:hypothetical protein
MLETKLDWKKEKITRVGWVSRVIFESLADRLTDHKSSVILDFQQSVHRHRG